MNHTLRNSALVLLLGISCLQTACAFVFSAPEGQLLDFDFVLEEELPPGEERLVTTFVPGQLVETRGRHLQISGALQRPRGTVLPRRLTLRATISDLASGREIQRLKIKLDVTAEDRFRGGKKIRKNLSKGTLLTVTVQPSGDSLPAGAEVRICADLVASRSDLRAFASCAAGDGPTTFATIQQEILTPTCALGGCHDAASAQAGLVLEAGRAYDELVAVPSTEIFLRPRVDPGDPDGSYLVQKIRGSSQIAGGRMPLGGPFLSEDRIAGVVEWIENGARRDQ